jgi:hypothetical protein
LAADQLKLGVAIVHDYRTGIYYVSTSSSSGSAARPLEEPYGPADNDTVALYSQ